MAELNNNKDFVKVAETKDLQPTNMKTVEVNDEKICQALAAMWSQIGVATRITAMPRANNVIPQWVTISGD